MSQTLKVGVFMSVALALLAWLILRVEDWSLFGEQGRRVDAVFESVVGLDDKAAVRVAGVRVGRVDGIRLEGRRARVTLLLDEKLTLTEGAEAVIANQGLLGDKFVELYPGPEGAPRLPDGTVLPGRTPISFDQAMAKLGEIGDTIQQTIGGLDSGEGGIGELVASMKATADELRAVIAENRAGFGSTVANFERFSATLAEDLPRLTEQIERVLGQIDAVVADNRENLSDSIENIKELTTSVQRSVDNLNSITDKMARGEGTIGKLLNSDEAHESIVGALESVETGLTKLGDTFGRVEKVKLDLGMEGFYLSEPEDWRTAFRIDVRPRGDESTRLYRVELVNDPWGRISEFEEVVTVTRPDGTVETTTTNRLERDERKNQYSALLGFPFWEGRGRLWAGLIQNTGGVQLDYGVVPDRLWLTFEAYDFSRELELDPHLRLTAQWFPWNDNLYLKAGYDDPLIDDRRSPFLGVGMRWSDDDLKYLMGSIPSF
jgi:phospholipid/cholesterol/gamma-HCH transport system substrate-binding protein